MLVGRYCSQFSGHKLKRPAGDLLALADVLMQKGDAAEAKRQYEAALHVRPDLDTANLGLGLLLASAGDRAASESHCEIALKSSDSEIREQARQCLRQ
jgi:tetratricopeptide (TPR) repeat protein